MKYIVDTNILLSNPEMIEKYDVVITSHVLREIEDLELKRRNDRTLQYEIRRAKRLLENIEYKSFELKDYKFNLDDNLDGDYIDNILVQVAYDNKFGIITNDVLLKHKCKMYNIPFINVDIHEFVDNKGYTEDYMTHEELIELYKRLDVNSYNLIVNEYLIIYDDLNIDELSVLDIFKWNGESLISIIKNNRSKIDMRFQTSQFGKFKPKDAYQNIAVDSIFSNSITQLRGKAGSGKSKIALETAWHLIERDGKRDGYEKLVIFTNPSPSRDAQELGFYKGDKLDKLLQSSVGAMLKSKFGDDIEIQKHIMNGRLDILPLVDIRGYETGDQRTILWIVESQNITTDLMKLALQRVSNNTKVIIDGDYHQQVDKDIYAISNGMKRVSEVFRGETVYGEVELQNIYRSEIASIADNM